MSPFHFDGITQRIGDRLKKAVAYAMNLRVTVLITMVPKAKKPRKPAIAFRDHSARIKPPCGKCPGCRAYLASLN